MPGPPGNRSLQACPRRRAAGFTLVELLVVIGVVALLVAILIPSLGRSRALARAAVCRSNLHQLWSTLHAGGDLALPDSTGWVGFVFDHGAKGVLRCPEDDREAGPGGTLDNYFIYHWHLLTYHIYAPIAEAIQPDAPLGSGVFIQMKAERPSENVTEIYLEGGGALRVILGSPTVIEGIYTFGMGAYRPWGSSQHWVVERVGDSYEKRMHLLGTDNLAGPIEPERLVLGGAFASYGMNNQVRPVGGGTDQLLLLDYERTVADVDGRGACDDILAETVAPRHLGRCNGLRVDGSCGPLWPWQLDADAPLWRP